MPKDYSRPLTDARLAQHFVENILGLKTQAEKEEAIDLINRAEMQLKQSENKSTLRSDNYRHSNYVDEASRKDLRTIIFEELIKYERPESDDDIILGFGGALPRGKDVKSESQAYIIIGSPASGKSTIANTVSDSTGSIILDSDFAKRKFPEFKKDFGASIVHDESVAIVFGKEDVTEYNMLEYCCTYKYNIVIPKIGHNFDSILKLTKSLKDSQYDVHITLVSLDRKKATQRAYQRFLETKRYVPLSLIFDTYSNEPILTYYRLKNDSIFKSYGKISTDIEKGKKPIFIEGSPENPARLFIL